jgi:hypothetical protein
MRFWEERPGETKRPRRERVSRLLDSKLVKTVVVAVGGAVVLWAIGH